MTEKRRILKPAFGPPLSGLLAAAIMIAFYLGLITLTSDWFYAWAQFSDYRWWIASLAAGFGLQVGLFSHLRRLSAAGAKGARSAVTASGTLSTVAMALCCSHYLATFLPIIGLPFLSAAVAGLGQYQVEFFMLGLASNLLGIGYMLRLISARRAVAAGEP